MCKGNKDRMIWCKRALGAKEAKRGGRLPSASVGSCMFNFFFFVHMEEKEEKKVEKK
jgi:hypothetical protein